jgi:integrase
MSTIRFELRRDADDKVPAAIRLFYQISGERKAFKTGQKIPAVNWDQDEQKAIFVRKGSLMQAEVEEINLELKGLEKRIRDIEKRFELDGIAYDIDAVSDAFLNSGSKASKASKELFAYIDDYIETHKKSREDGSLSVYRSLKGHLLGYERATKLTVSLSRIDHRFFQAFENFLSAPHPALVPMKAKKGEEKKMVWKIVSVNNVTRAKLLSTLKTFLSYARKDGIEIRDVKFSVKRENNLEIIALSEQEYKAVRDLDLTEKPALDRVRDAFVFSCATGLRYSDLKDLTRDQIKEDHIDKTIVKTRTKLMVPLSPDALSILAKYKSEERPLPVISNQKSNIALEKVCKLAGLDARMEIVRMFGTKRVKKVYPRYELIRMHCGRKTFATRMIALGMRAEIVMKIGGWKSWASFKRYMHLSDDTIKAEMRAVFSNQSKLKAV